MAKGYKIFPRSKAYRDNWDQTFIKKDKKPKWNPKLGPQTALIIKDCIFENCGQVVLPSKPTSREIKGITE